MKALERMEANAKQLISQYDKSERLLSDAIKETMGWAVPLAMHRTMPSLPQLERLATQLIAIIIASEPSDG